MLKTYIRRSVLTVAIIGVLIPLYGYFISDNPQQINNEKKAIIFDLGGVLFHVDMRKALAHFGAHNLLMYGSLDWKSPTHIKKSLYKVIHTVSEKPSLHLKDPYGDHMPLHMCDVMIGKRCETQCLKEVKKIVKENKTLFSSSREYRLCLKATDLLFSPEKLAEITLVSQEGIDFIKECKAAGHEVFILSNFGAESFALLKKKFSELFTLFKDEHIIVSAHVGHAKPHPQIYTILLERIKNAGIDPHYLTCFFIDDQYENIESAHQSGITGIHQKQFKHIKKELKNYGLLKPIV